MATDDCSVIGVGSCPCGRGKIEVEHCIPDYPWAKPHQAFYRYSIQCEKCREDYAFCGTTSPDTPSRLVNRKDLERVEGAKSAWHEKLREIERSPAFTELRRRVESRLGQERSVAAQYRVLAAARLTAGMSEQRYRKQGFQLSPLHIAEAIALVQGDFPELTAMAKEEDELAEAMRRTPPAIKTGIRGVEA